MHLFQLLRAIDDEVAPERCKIHLAVWNGTEEPLDVYLAGQFDEWQSWQSRKNFERPLVVSLIALPRKRNWLFVGVHNSEGCEWVAERSMHRYRLHRRAKPEELDGRLVVHFERSGRQSFLKGENWAQSFEIAEILRERLRVAEFPGFSSAMLSKQRLDLVVERQIDSWRSALASVAGVYVVADRHTGKLYVGSACGGQGIWSRWCAYSQSGHGGNRELRELLRREGGAYAKNFQFGVLEIADTHASTDDIQRREGYWKELLLSRVPHGYNAN